MKVILVILLLALSQCQDQIDGGWEKRSFNENDLEINEAYNASFEEYKKINSAAEKSDLVPLTVYTQIVSGMNYKICFVDKKADYLTIHEFYFYKPLAVNNEGKEEYKLQEHNQYTNIQGLLDYKDEKFTLIEKALYKLLKKSNIKLNYISFIIPIENGQTNFFMASAETDNGINLYIVCQDKESQEFYAYKKIN